jgi:chromate transporter
LSSHSPDNDFLKNSLPEFSPIEYIKGMKPLHSLLEVLRISLKLGLTSFGGPVAHIGYFHHEYVTKRQWLDERNFTDLIALTQFLPGPASSQLGIAIGAQRAGFAGGIIAWIGFTLPSALLMILFGFLYRQFHLSGTHWIHGLKIVALAVVAHAVLNLWKKLITGGTLATVAILSMITLILFQSALVQLGLILIAGAAGLFFLKNPSSEDLPVIHPGISRLTAILCLILFFLLLFILPVLSRITGNLTLSIADSFYRAGSLVFGGGHVVLPMLEEEIVPRGWMTAEEFIAGYGAAQTVPGPLFTFSAYLGLIIAGPAGAVISLLAIFLPSFLLVYGILPFWSRIRTYSVIQKALSAVNASVVGILLAALYKPVMLHAILSPADLAIAIGLFGMLAFWKIPPWLAVIIGVTLRTITGLAGVV